MSSELSKFDRLALSTYMDIMEFDDDDAISAIFLGAVSSGCLYRLFTKCSVEHAPFVDALRNVVNRSEFMFIAPGDVASEELKGLVLEKINIATMLQVKAAVVLTDIMLGYAATRTDGGILDRFWFYPSDTAQVSDQIVKFLYGATATDIAEFCMSTSEDNRQCKHLMSVLFYNLGRIYLDRAIVDYYTARLGENSDIVDADRIAHSAMVNLISAHSMVNSSIMLLSDENVTFAAAVGELPSAREGADQYVVISSVIRDYDNDPMVKMAAGISQSVAGIIMWMFSTIADYITGESIIDFKDGKPTGFMADFSRLFGFDDIVFDFYRDFFGCESYDEAFLRAAEHMQGKSNCQCAQQIMSYMKKEVSISAIKSSEWVEKIGGIIRNNHSGEEK